MFIIGYFNRNTGELTKLTLAKLLKSFSAISCSKSSFMTNKGEVLCFINLTLTVTVRTSFNAIKYTNKVLRLVYYINIRLNLNRRSTFQRL